MLGQKLSQQWYSAPYGVQSTAPDLHRFPSRSWPVSCKGRSYAMGHLSSSSRLIASLRLTVEQILSSALVLINAALNRSIRTDHLTTYYFHTEYEVHVLPDLSNEWPILYLVTTRKHTYSLSLSSVYMHTYWYIWSTYRVRSILYIPKADHFYTWLRTPYINYPIPRISISRQAQDPRHSRSCHSHEWLD